jgi:hypothetical protein
MNVPAIYFSLNCKCTQASMLIGKVLILFNLVGKLFGKTVTHCPFQFLDGLENTFLWFSSLVTATAGSPPSDGDCHHFLSHPSWWGCLLFMIIRLHSSLSFWAGIQKQISTSIFPLWVSSLQTHTCHFLTLIRQKLKSRWALFWKGKERQNLEEQKSTDN